MVEEVNSRQRTNREIVAREIEAVERVRLNNKKEIRTKKEIERHQAPKKRERRARESLRNKKRSSFGLSQKNEDTNFNYYTNHKV